MGLLSRFEHKVENTVDTAADKMFDAPISPIQIEKKAEKQMLREKMVASGKQIAPTLYTVLVNDSDDAKLCGFYPTLAGEIETFLMARAESHGLHLDGDPLVRFIVDENLKPGKFEVIAELVSANIIDQLRQEELALYGLSTPEPIVIEEDNRPRPQNVTANAVPPYGEGANGYDAYDANDAFAPASLRGDFHVIEDDYRQQNLSGQAVPNPYMPSANGENVHNAALQQQAAMQQPYQQQFAQPAQSYDQQQFAQQAQPHVQQPYVPYAQQHAAAQAQQQYGQQPQPFDQQQYAQSYDQQALQQAVPQVAAGAAACGVAAGGAAAFAADNNTPSNWAPSYAAQAHLEERKQTYGYLKNLTDKRIYSLARRIITIGRDESCNIVLNDINASRTHAQLSLDDYGTWTLIDLGSTNGTAVNGRLITSIALQPGDSISIGMTQMVFTDKK